MPSSTLTVVSGRKVILVGGAQACNIFWQVGSAATLGTYSDFKGNILAESSITVTTGVTMEGSALAKNGAVTYSGNTLTKHAPTIHRPAMADIIYGLGELGD